MQTTPSIAFRHQDVVNQCLGVQEQDQVYLFVLCTHSFLLKGEEPPMCIGCDELLTSEHILLTCSDLIEIRESHFTAQSLRVLFQEISLEKIFNFLKDINILDRISTFK